MFKLVKYKLLIFLLAVNSQTFAITEATMDSFSPSLMNMSLRQYLNKLNKSFTSSKIVEPSKFYKPTFYEKNELKEVFETYEFVRNKIENPVEMKKADLVKDMEMSLLPHFKSTSVSSVSYTDFMFSLEIRAVFL